MGMGSSQARLLALTDRKSAISFEQVRLSNRRQSLTREMQNVSLRYNQALNSKVLKLSNDSGVTYTDMNYSTLMTPSAFNQNKPYLITNSNGRVILNDKYKKYAQMISENGAPGGDYESNRIYILSQLTGIPESKFDDYNSATDATGDKVDSLEKAKDATTIARKKAFETLHDDDFVSKWGNAGGVDFSKTKVGHFGKVDLGNSVESAKAKIASIADGIYNNMSPYLEEKALNAFDTALKAQVTDVQGLIDGANNGSKTDYLTKDGDNYNINMDAFISAVMGGFVSECANTGSGCATKDSQDNYKFEVIAGLGKEDDNYKAYLDAKAAEEAAKAEYKNAVNDENQVFTAEEETKIQFYDLLFNAIAEKGWEEDTQIKDSEYLSNMLQNNVYTITTVEENSNYDENEKYDSSRKNKYNYNTDIASNFDKIFIVNDEDARQEALVNYEFEKSAIKAKEAHIDERVNNLKTEEAAIIQMIKGIEQVIKDNSERNFSIFS